MQIMNNPYFAFPTMDPLYHDVWAQNIAGGNWIGTKIFFRAPFYAYFLALIYKVFGHNYFIPRLIQHIIGSFSCVLVYVLAKKIFNRKVSFLSAIFASTYWILIYFEGELLLDSLLVFFDLILMILLLNASDNPGWKRWMACGAVLGLSAITRPNILVFIPLVWLWIILIFKNSKKLGTIFSYIAFFSLGATLVILPVTVRNYVVGGDFVLIASQGGVNFYIGNNPKADGISAAFHDTDLGSRNIESLKKLKPSEISNLYYKEGFEFIFSQPITASKLLFKKLYMSWNAFEVSNNQNAYFFKRYSPLIRILPIGFWLVGPLSLVGMGLSFGSKRKTVLLVLFILSYTATTVMFFVADRYRLPVLPFLIIFSSYAIFWFIEKIHQGDLLKIISFTIVTVLLFWLTNSNLYHLDKSDFSQSYFSLGNLYLKQGKLEEASKLYGEVLARDPLTYKVHLNLGMIYFKQMNWDKAEEEFSKELKVNPNEDKAYNNLSVVYRFRKDYSNAIAMAKRALEIAPYYEEAYINLSLAYEEKGDLKDSRQILYRALQALPQSTLSNFLLAYSYQNESAFDSALNYYRKVIEQSSAKQDVLYNLGDLSSRSEQLSGLPQETQAFTYHNMGLILARMGKLDQAEKLFINAIELKEDFASAYSALGNLYRLKEKPLRAIQNFRKATEYDPDNPTYYYNLAMSFVEVGETGQAARMFEKALSLDPGFEEAKTKLSQITKHTKH